MKVLNIDGAVSTLSFIVIEWKKNTSILSAVCILLNYWGISIDRKSRYRRILKYLSLKTIFSDPTSYSVFLGMIVMKHITHYWEI